MDDLIENLAHLLGGIPYFLILLLTLVLGKFVYAWTTPYQIDDELTKRDNGAFGVHLALYLLGLALALGGTLFRGRFGDGEGLALVAGFGVVSVGLMRLSIWLNERLLFPEFNIYKEMIQDHNAGTGCVLGGSCVATGLMINGALSVEAGGESLGERVLWATVGTALFYVLGQLLILGGAWVFRKIAGYDVHRSVEHDNNLAAGIAYGGFLASLGIIVRSALVGATANLLQEVTTTLVYAAVGLLLLAGAQVFADRVLLPKSRLWKEVAVDKNPAAGLVAAACFVCVALAFAWVVAH